MSHTKAIHDFFPFSRWAPLILSAVRHHLQWPTGEMKTKKNPVSRLSKARESLCDRQKVQVRNRFWFWWCLFLILITIWKMLCHGTLCGSKIPLEFFDLAVWLTVYNQFQVKYILLIKYVIDPKSQKCVGGIFTKSTLKKIALRQMFSFSIPVIDLFSTKLLTKHQTLLLSSTVSIRIKYGAVMWPNI